MDKKEKIVSIRMTETDYKYLKATAFTIGMTPSRLVRMLVDSSINVTKMKVKKGELSLADIETLCDDNI